MATQRRARAVWEGDLFEGSGRVWTQSTDLLAEVPVTWASRAEDPQGRTSPEELLAAAHAACFSMAASNELASRGATVERLEVTAEATFAKSEAGFRVTSMELDLRARASGIEEAAFREAAEAARDGCPISQALKGNVAVSLTAALEA